MKRMSASCVLDISSQRKGRVTQITENGVEQPYPAFYRDALATMLLSRLPQHLTDVSLHVYYVINKAGQRTTVLEYEILQYDQQYWHHHFIMSDVIKAITRPEAKERMDANIEEWERFYGERFSEYKGKITHTPLRDGECPLEGLEF